MWQCTTEQPLLWPVRVECYADPLKGQERKLLSTNAGQLRRGAEAFFCSKAVCVEPAHEAMVHQHLNPEAACES